MEGPAAHALEHQRLLAVGDKGSRQFLAWSPHPSFSLRLTRFPLGAPPSFPQGRTTSAPPHPPATNPGKDPLASFHPSPLFAPDYLAEALTLAWPVKTRTKTRT